MIILETTRIKASVSAIDSHNTSVVNAMGSKRGRLAITRVTDYYRVPYIAMYQYLHNEGIIASAIRGHRSSFADIIGYVILQHVYDYNPTATTPTLPRAARVSHQYDMISHALLLSYLGCDG
jgi:hypothetical protein